jgi:hypothetical protein
MTKILDLEALEKDIAQRMQYFESVRIQKKDRINSVSTSFAKDQPNKSSIASQTVAQDTTKKESFLKSITAFFTDQPKNK